MTAILTHRAPPAPSARRLPALTGVDPVDALGAWPEGASLAALVTADPRRDADGARWTVLGAPSRDETIPAGEPRAFERLRATVGGADPRARRAPARAGDRRLPFAGGWIGWLSYDLGRALEPTAVATDRDAPRGAPDDRGWPLAHLARCDGAYVHDARDGAWFLVGDPAGLPAPGDIAAGAPAPPADARVRFRDADAARARFTGSVARVVEAIRAGDLFQANIAHRLTGETDAPPRAIFRRLLDAARPRFGAFVGGADAAVCSISPELFLAYDPATRRARTRPIKGTRPDRPGASDELRASAKDAAELVMIVDLMRNDLGRVCEPGSVRVERPRDVERHAGVVHGVATVEGTLAPGRDALDLLAASFPPGSVTGAPKVRAMQVIDAHEPARRGPYCGAVGAFSDCGAMNLSVAIRTAAWRRPPPPPGAAGPRPATLDYWVGAGIVADSDPDAEWAETLDKASAFRAALGDAP